MKYSVILCAALLSFFAAGAQNTSVDDARKAAAEAQHKVREAELAAAQAHVMVVHAEAQAMRAKDSALHAEGGVMKPDIRKHSHNISLGSGGIHYNNDKPYKTHLVELQFGMLDLGINTLQDKTDYSSAEAQQFLKVDAAHKNADLFSLRNSKSVNVNIYPVMLKMQLHKSETQRWQLATGLGLQIYNFRFTKPVTYVNDPVPSVTLDTISFSKNKLALNYLTVPLMINGKTRLARGNYDSAKEGRGSGTWLTYGVGMSGGYLLSSWTKQISDERGKDKNHDPFNLSKTNFCVNGEIGLDGFIRLYASYQLTTLHTDGLDQHPFSIGVRFLGL